MSKEDSSSALAIDPCHRIGTLKILQNFSYFPSHRIFRRMHGVLNIDENKN